MARLLEASMLQIEITIDRPIQTLLIVGAVVGFVGWNLMPGNSKEEVQAAVLTDEAKGGDDTPDVVKVLEEERDVLRLRIEQKILAQREEILRYQIRTLEEELHTHGESGGRVEEYEQGLQSLLALLRDKMKAEQELIATFREMWEVQGRAVEVAAKISAPTAPVRIIWPLINLPYGISAGFLDAAYKTQFGFDHQGIDMPIERGSVIHAAADGVVEEVNDNGYGYNSLVVRHDGFVTVYGHVRAFLVQAGQTVRTGEPVALSGAMPGEPGAGNFTTGPHLHFELIVGGTHVNPLEYLPEWSKDR